MDHDKHLVEEISNDIDFTEKVTHMRCMGCYSEWDLTEKAGEFFRNVACPWCRTACAVPRPINGSRR